MLTPTHIATSRARAGDDFTYPGVSGTSRPPSLWRLGLRHELVDYAGGVCFWCGDGGMDADDTDTVEFCHFVSRGPAKLGWMEGNIGAGHPKCNDCRERQEDGTIVRTCADGKPCQLHYGPVLHVEAMARPDVVKTDWSPVPILKARTRELRGR